MTNLKNVGYIFQVAQTVAQMSFNAIQTGLFLLPRTGGGGELRRPYPCNSVTAYGMTPKFTQNDILIISII